MSFYHMVYAEPDVEYLLFSKFFEACWRSYVFLVCENCVFTEEIFWKDLFLDLNLLEVHGFYEFGRLTRKYILILLELAWSSSLIWFIGTCWSSYVLVIGYWKIRTRFDLLELVGVHTWFDLSELAWSSYLWFNDLLQLVRLARSLFVILINFYGTCLKFVLLIYTWIWHYWLTSYWYPEISS